MSDWQLLNACRVSFPGVPGSESSAADGFNGFFQVRVNGHGLNIIASDEPGWQHVSVSITNCPGFTPSWSAMCQVRDLFWEPSEWVVQFHPPVSEYVNNHEGCLHLWRCTDGRATTTPPSILVGLRELNR